MAADFHEVQFPADISYGSAGGPEFSTEVISFGNGHEQRNQNWTYPRERWNVVYGVRRKEDVDALIVFFMARCGRLYGFRFKNWNDFEAVDQECDPVLGSSDQFQLMKQYTSGSETLNRKITKPVADTVSIYVDGSPLGPGDFEVDYETGIVTLDSVPSSGDVVTADFEFDVPVRFDTDHLPESLDTYLARSVNVELVEVRV